MIYNVIGYFEDNGFEILGAFLSKAQAIAFAKQTSLNEDSWINSILVECWRGPNCLREEWYWER